MKCVVTFLLAVFVVGCASIREESTAVGIFRLREFGATHEIDLRSDHSCVLSSYGIAEPRSRADARWSFDEGIVTISPKDSPAFSFRLARHRFELALVSTEEKRVYVRLPKERPNQPPEPM